MSAHWIPMRAGLEDDPHVTAAAARLDVDPDLIVGKLKRMWSVADEQTDDGVLVGWTPAMLDRKVGLPGFAEALVKGPKGDGADPWLVVRPANCEPAALIVPEFEKHMGSKGRMRERARTRAAALRDENRTDTRTRSARKAHAEAHGPGTTVTAQRQEEQKTPPVPAAQGHPPALREEPRPGGAAPLSTEHGALGTPTVPGGMTGADLELARGMEAIAAESARRPVPDAPASRLTTGRKPKPRAHGFERFYGGYPRKEAPDAAERAFVRAVGRMRSRDPTMTAEAAAARIAERAAAFAMSDVARGPREFIPHPATWLNDGRYDDDDGAWQRGGDGGSGGGSGGNSGVGGGRGDAGAGAAPRGPASGAGPRDRGGAAGARGAGAVRRT